MKNAKVQCKRQAIAIVNNINLIFSFHFECNLVHKTSQSRLSNSHVETNYKF